MKFRTWIDRYKEFKHWGFLSEAVNEGTVFKLKAEKVLEDYAKSLDKKQKKK